jgi:chromosome segregation ATPase
MASESTDDPISVSLPPDLAEWVAHEATERGTDRETVLVQLLAAYRAAETVDPDTALDEVAIRDVETEVRDVVADRLPDIADAVADRLEIERAVSEALDDNRDEISQAATEQAVAETEDRIAAVESDFADKLDDVRDRVVQVKREADAKAPADHDHPALDDRMDDLAATVRDLDADLSTLRQTVSEHVDEYDGEMDEVTDALEDTQQKLQTVAHVVKDLRDRTGAESKRGTSVEGIKRSAARHDIDRAACEACGEGVDIALMTDPECPHCGAAVTDVEPKDGFLGKPHLVTPHGIEAGADE